MSVRSERLAVGLILAAAFLLFTTYGLSTPLFEASDELWHYPLVQHIAASGDLPEQRKGQSDATAPWRQEGSQPPLYYVVAAIASAPFDSSNWRDIRRLNPHSDLGRPTVDGNLNAVVHTSAELFPWSSAARAIYAARLVSIIFSTLTVLCAYLVACELFPRHGRKSSDANLTAPDKDDRAWLRLAVPSLTASVPMFAFISGSVNNDNAAAMFSTLGLWLALRLTRRGQLSIKTALIAGGVSACAALSKSSTLGLLGLFSFAVVFAGIRLHSENDGRPLSATIRDAAVFLAVMFLTTFIIAGWWFIRNRILYSDWLGWNAFLDAVGRRVPPASLFQLWSEREGFVWAYWGVFGTLNVIMPHTVYDILNGVVLLSLIAIAWAGIRVIFQRPAPISDPASTRLRWRSELIRLSPFILCAAWLVVTFVALLRWTSLTPASQGRLMFPCIAVLSALIAYGCYRFNRIFLGLVVAGFAILAFSVPFMVIAPVYAKPTPINQPEPTHPLSVTFEGQLDLLGYDLSTDTAATESKATLYLYWRAHGPLTQNASVYVHLLNEDNVMVGQRDMYPGQGLLATTELSAGYAWRDRYTVLLSPLLLTPQKLHWAVGLYDVSSGSRLSVTAGTYSDQGVELSGFELKPAASSKLLLDYGNGIQLIRYDVSPRSLQAGQSVTVTLDWLSTTRGEQDYIVSLQLIDEKTNKVAQSDSAPVNGNAPTSTWVADQRIEDVHVLNVSSGAPPGAYRLLLVLYRPNDFAHLGAYASDGIYLGDEVSLMSFAVK